MLVDDMSRGSRVILPVQYLRGIAALLVVWQHAKGRVPGFGVFLPSDFGLSGVDVFFVISGFIMTVTTARTDMTAGKFLLKRVIRVVPLYWLLTFAIAVDWLIRPPGPALDAQAVTAATVIESLLFIPHFSNVFPDKVWPLLVPGWTLDFEMFFYLVFAASLFLVPSRRLSVLTAVLGCLAAVGALWGPFAVAAAQIYTSPLLLEFLAGAWIGLSYVAGRHRVPAVGSLLLVVFGSICLLMRDDPPFGQAFQIAGAAMLIFGAINPLFERIDLPALRMLGDSSYSLYLTHVFVLSAMRMAWQAVFSSTPTLPHSIAFVSLALPVCVGVGWLTFRWIESPLTRGLTRAVSPTRPGPMTPSRH